MEKQCATPSVFQTLAPPAPLHHHSTTPHHHLSTQPIHFCKKFFYGGLEGYSHPPFFWGIVWGTLYPNQPPPPKAHKKPLFDPLPVPNFQKRTITKQTERTDGRWPQTNTKKQFTIHKGKNVVISPIYITNIYISPISIL